MKDTEKIISDHIDTILTLRAENAALREGDGLEAKTVQAAIDHLGCADRLARLRRVADAARKHRDGVPRAYTEMCAALADCDEVKP